MFAIPVLVSIFPRTAALLGALALGVLGAACADDGSAPLESCNGAKCDDPVGTPTAHSAAVLECDRQLDNDLAAAGDSIPLAIKGEIYFRECLRSADNGALATVENNLIQIGAPLRSRAEIEIVFDEYRYSSLCVDIESASALVGDALDLRIASCEAGRERSLAQVIGALVRFADEATPPWALQEERTTFAECYRVYDETLAKSDASWAALVAQQDLAGCAGNVLRGQAEPLMEARCEQEVCEDELLVLSFVQAGFETALSTSDRMCQLLVDSSVYQRLGAPEQRIDCRMTVYSELARQVAAGLP